MISRFMTFGALALACILAAGGGAYIAVRQSQNASAQGVSQPAAASPQAPAKASPTSIVTTPPAAGDAAAGQPAAPLVVAPAEPSAPSSDTHRAVQPARPSRTGAERKRVDRTADAAAASTSTPPPAQPGPADGTALPVPQSVTQPPAEPQREYVDVEVPAESVLGLQVQTTVSSDTARVEDRVEARVTRDVRVGDRVAVPAGSQAEGTVVQVDRGGRVKEAARIAIRFNSLILPDGTRLPITAEAVHREGPSPANRSAARIGGATVGGAILGAILGGGKGAAIGGAIGAGGGTAAAMAGDRQPATLAAGSVVNIRLMSPVTVTLER